MTRYYCPQCWHDFAEDLNTCPDCGINIKEFYESKDYIDKLILALKSPEAGTPVRASMILGKIKDRRAVQPLMECVQNNTDIFIVLEAIKALGEIGDMEAIKFLVSLQDHPDKIVQDQIKATLNSFHKE